VSGARATSRGGLLAAGQSAAAAHLIRVPVFDQRHAVTAYEVAAVAARPGDEGATTNAIRELVGGAGLGAVTGTTPAHLVIPLPLLPECSSLGLDRSEVVLQVPSSWGRVPSAAESVAALEREGFRFAVTVSTSDIDSYRSLLDSACTVKVDINVLTPAELLVLIRQLRAYPVSLTALRVNSRAEADRALLLGFDSFSGLLMQEPGAVSDRPVEPTAITCMQLIGLLSEPDASVADIEAVVRVDPGLSLRILRAVNSSDAGLTNLVSSMRQAIVLLGRRNLLSWVMLMTLAGDGGGASEQIAAALTRARLCELLAGGMGAEPEAAFVVGLLSSMDVLLAAPLPSLLTTFPIEDHLREAILHHEGALGRALADAKHYLNGRFGEVEAIETFGAAAVRETAISAYSWSIRTLVPRQRSS
jgi:EAL and modified HD-GYP domain-containing signal transduction protein